MPRLLPLALIALLFQGTNAHAGIVRGVVRAAHAVESGGAAPNAYPGRANALANPATPPRGHMTDAVVYVESVDDSVTEPTGGGEPQLVQEHQAFSPRVVAVLAGGRVSFPNRDAIYHNVFSLSPTRRFDLGKYPQGQTKHVRFDRPGLVKVYCDIHSNMEAFVLVLPNRFFARPNERGEFQLPELPAGRYTLVAWHPDYGEVRESIEVTGNGTHVELGF